MFNLRTVYWSASFCFAICFVSGVAYAEELRERAHKAVFLPVEDCPGSTTGTSKVLPTELQGSVGPGSINFGPIENNKIAKVSPEIINEMVDYSTRHGNALKEVHFWSCYFEKGALDQLPKRTINNLSIKHSTFPHSWANELQQLQVSNSIEIEAFCPDGPNKNLGSPELLINSFPKLQNLQLSATPYQGGFSIRGTDGVLKRVKPIPKIRLDSADTN